MKLKIVDPTSLDKEDRSELDANIDSLIAGLKDSRQEINRLVFESVSAITAGENFEKELANKKGLKRFLGAITGSNKKLQDKINSNRTLAQYAAQQILQRLVEQNLMSLDLIIAVNNKLNASVKELEGEINEIYRILLEFFSQVSEELKQHEKRISKIERAQKYLIAGVSSTLLLVAVFGILIFKTRVSAPSNTDVMNELPIPPISSEIDATSEVSPDTVPGDFNSSGNQVVEQQESVTNETAQIEDTPDSIKADPQSENNASLIEEIDDSQSQENESIDLHALEGTWFLQSYAAYINIFQIDETYYIAFTVPNGGFAHYLQQPAALLADGKYAVASYDEDNEGNHGTIKITFSNDGEPLITATMNDSSTPIYNSSDDELLYLIVTDAPIYSDPDIKDYPVYKKYLDPTLFSSLSE